MNISALSRTTLALALTAVLAATTAPVKAETTGSPLFPSLSLSPARDRMFLRFQYVYAHIKTKSEDAKDVTGAVVKPADLQGMLDAMPRGLSPVTGSPCLRVQTSTGCTQELVSQQRVRSNYSQAIGSIEDEAGLLNAIALDYPVAGGLGTPAGIRAKADNSATLALSLGYFLDDTYNWAVEALILGAPLSVDVYGGGTNATGSPNGLSGKKIITTKILPPTVTVGRYFGHKDSKIRPFLGIGAMYAIFFDSKATQALNEYQGGGKPGDTTVTVKNTVGVGPFVGLQAELGGGWRLGFNVGQVRLKTDATLVTKNTTITGQSGVINDYGPNVEAAIEVGRGFDLTPAGAPNPLYPNGFITRFMSDLAAYKASTGTGDGTLGTYVRKQTNTFDNTIFFLSVARNF